MSIFKPRFNNVHFIDGPGGDSDGYGGAGEPGGPGGGGYGGGGGGGFGYGVGDDFGGPGVGSSVGPDDPGPDGVGGGDVRSQVASMVDQLEQQISQGKFGTTTAMSPGVAPQSISPQAALAAHEAQLASQGLLGRPTGFTQWGMGTTGRMGMGLASAAKKGMPSYATSIPATLTPHTIASLYGMSQLNNLSTLGWGYSPKTGWSRSGLSAASKAMGKPLGIETAKNALSLGLVNAVAPPSFSNMYGIAKGAMNYGIADEETKETMGLASMPGYQSYSQPEVDSEGRSLPYDDELRGTNLRDAYYG